MERERSGPAEGAARPGRGSAPSPRPGRAEPPAPRRGLAAPRPPPPQVPQGPARAPRDTGGAFPGGRTSSPARGRPQAAAARGHGGKAPQGRVPSDPPGLLRPPVPPGIPRGSIPREPLQCCAGSLQAASAEGPLQFNADVCPALRAERCQARDVVAPGFHVAFFATMEHRASQQLGMFGSGRESQLLDYVWSQCTTQGSDTEFWTQVQIYHHSTLNKIFL
ncbi:basic salivary proline-rich protein 1-like [Parus major]|uniref:basic salivary proline-rich protein 1-like n=1 Tax=Parus major TaxID=9157 RepID=UPI001443C341|nr:basic salivary proline-rich protein 1-like [Parus major]